MARFKFAANNFAAGEISPKAQGRSDLPEIKQALSQYENMVTLPTGGGTRRPGTVYVKTYTTGACHTIFPFVISKTESYVVYLSSSAIEIVNVTTKAVYTSGSGITIGSGVYYIGNPSDETRRASEVRVSKQGNKMWIAHPRMMPLVLERTNANTFTLYRYDDLSLYQNIKSASSTVLDPFIARHAGIPVRDPNSSTESFALTLNSASGAADGVLVSAIATRKFYKEEWYLVNQAVTTHSVGWWARVVSNATGTCTVDTFDRSGASTGLTTRWIRGAWGGDNGATVSGEPGYPGAVIFYDGRIIYAGSPELSTTMWLSEANRYLVMHAPHTFNSAMPDLHEALIAYQAGNAAAGFFVPASEESNPIKWMIPRDKLAVGSIGEEFAVFGPDQSSSFGPVNVSIRPQTSYGSADCKAISVDSLVFFVQRGGRNVLAFKFSNDIQNFEAQDLSVLSDHIITKNLDEHRFPSTCFATNYDGRENNEWKYSVYQPLSNVIWFVDSHGSLASLTFKKETGVTSWARHKLGGTYTNATWATATAEAPSVVAICSTPSPAGNGDMLWLLVDRNVNGSQVTFLEYMPPEFNLRSIEDTDPGPSDAYQYAERKPIYSDAAVFGCLESTPADFDGTDVNTGTEVITLGAGHGLWNGSRVLYTVGSGGSITGLTTGTYYYVISKTSTTVKLSDTIGGSAIDLTAASGTGHTLTASSGTVWDGYSHLIGQTVKVVADGRLFDDEVVDANGQITLGENVSEVIGGLSYTSKVKTCKLEAGSIFGSAQNDIRRIDQATIKFYRTIGASYGKNEDDTLTDIDMRASGLSATTPTALFTGEKTVEFPGGYDRDTSGFFYIEQPDPLPFAITGIFLRGVTYD